MSEPGQPAEQGDTPSEGHTNPRELIEAVAAALKQGRAPRAGRYLQTAARELATSLDPEGAAHALRLVALLELRRGKPQQALRPTRAAERLLRDQGASAEYGAVLDLLSRLHSLIGEHAQAIRVAERWIEGDPARAAAAIRRLALAKWAASDVAGAFELLEPAEAGALNEHGLEVANVILMARMLVYVGCPTAAQAFLTRLLKTDLPPAQECDAHQSRGWAALCLGQPDQALRSFRRAVRLAADPAESRRAAEAEVALATGEVERVRVKGADLARAEARLQRKRTQAARLGLQHLAVPGRQPVGESALGAATAKEAAQSLVALTRTSESLSLVDACCLEVDRLSGLPSGSPPYSFSQVPSLSLE